MPEKHDGVTAVVPPALFDDNPALVDLLGFDAIVAPIIDALKHDGLDPITLGVHAPWGGGKSTVLNLIEGKKDDSWVIVRTTPWEYEDQFDVKGILISEVLAVLSPLAEKQDGLKGKVEGLLRRVSWSRVGMALAKGAFTMQWDPEKILDAFTLAPKEGPQSLEAFRTEFEDLVAGLPGVTKVVVLVDDLDRCLPGAVLATLEAIKLFLSVKRMAFVIAADQNMVREAIGASHEGRHSDEFANRYLEKIVQLPISMPRLSPLDSEAYITLLLAGTRTGPDGAGHLASEIRERRISGRPLLDDFPASDWSPSEEELALAKQLNDGISAEQRGNPRAIKRLLNAFAVRGRIVLARGISIRPGALMKMLLLEERHERAFEFIAGKHSQDRSLTLTEWETWGASSEGAPPGGASEEMRGWAASQPRIGAEDLDAYITLAATLVGASLGSGLSDGIRRVLSGLAAESEVLQREAIELIPALSTPERHRLATAMLEDLRRVDDPDRLQHTLEGMIALAKVQPDEMEPLAHGVRTRLFRRLSPAMGLLLVGTGMDAFENLADDALGDGSVPSPAKAAIRSGREKP